MVKIENYPNAYKEVYEILKFVPTEDINKISKEFIEMIEKNMNKEYNFSINPNIDFLEEQSLMLETRTILAYIFLNYWGTEKQKETIKLKFKKDIADSEGQKRQLYDVNVFTNKEKLKDNNKKIEMVVYKKENFIIKIFNKIRRFFIK